MHAVLGGDLGSDNIDAITFGVCQDLELMEGADEEVCVRAIISTTRFAERPAVPLQLLQRRVCEWSLPGEQASEGSMYLH